MLQFLKYVLATIIGLVVFVFLSIFILAEIGAAFSSGDKVSVKENSILRLNLNGPIQEISEENPFADLGGPFSGNENVTGLSDIKTALRTAKTNANIKGIYLKSDSPNAGWATLEEIRSALIDFKSSKKFIYTYSDSYSEKGYYLASVADKIILNPVGGMEWNGLSAEYEFYKGTLDKLNIKPEVFRVGEFKSAVEPFIRTDMSESSKKQTAELLGAINSHFLKKIAESRSIDVQKLSNLADSLAVENTSSALANKFVTQSGYFDELETAIRTQLKLEKNGKINYIGVKDLVKSPEAKQEGDFNTRIAVIVAQGEITDDNGDGGITPASFIKELRKARDDKKVKAIVLRINSPGGSALASDIIWREIQLAKKEKPVIASMSDVAASGGYYLSMGADRIFAQPNTITGSIGIFGLMLDTKDFFQDKIGITFDRVNTNAHSDFPTAVRHMSDFEKSRIQQMVNEGYEIFTSKAASGRKMDIAALKAVAGGRVWSGVQAKEKGLIDELGGLDAAVAYAAKTAKLKEGDYRIRYYPEKKDVMDELINKLTGSSDEDKAKILGPLAPYAKTYQKLMDMQGVQTRLPSVVDIR